MVNTSLEKNPPAELGDVSIRDVFTPRAVSHCGQRAAQWWHNCFERIKTLLSITSFEMVLG